MNSEYPYPKMNAQNRGLSCFDLRILITPLVSTNSSSNTITEYPGMKTFIYRVPKAEDTHTEPKPTYEGRVPSSEEEGRELQYERRLPMFEDIEHKIQKNSEAIASPGDCRVKG